MTHLDYVNYLQSHLNTVICELERQQTLLESDELKFIQENNGGHIRRDLDALGENIDFGEVDLTTPIAGTTFSVPDTVEHSDYYWQTDRNT